ncbi:hypothetical protein FS749_004693 [Ceratobasidium sp. UAMH 11750]|nr:hypothetical protein FS749_004693 [Ceratobasidium sp. UAMH 11750]
MENTTSPGTARAAALYDQGSEFVARAAKNVRGLEDLRNRLRNYERQLPPEAEQVSIEEAESTWHPAAARVFRNPATFAQNWDPSKVVYPLVFRLRLAEGHIRWSASALYHWFASEPFWDQQSNVLKGGTSGIAVAFWAIVQYVENVARLAPDDGATRYRLKELMFAKLGAARFPNTVKTRAVELTSALKSLWHSNLMKSGLRRPT